MNELELELYSLKTEVVALNNIIKTAKEYNETLEDVTLEEILCGER